MARFKQRQFQEFTADPGAPGFSEWPIKRLLGFEIELTGNRRRDPDEDDDEPGDNDDACSCGMECPNGSDCASDGCDYCHADEHVDPFARYDRASPVDTACREIGASIVSDGSLGSSGVEIVTPAMAGHHVPAAISTLTEAIRREGLIASSVCGLHIHADGRDLSWYDLRRVILAYVYAEPVLLLTVPERRRHGTYSQSCGSYYREMLQFGQTTHETKAGLARGMYGMGLDTVKGWEKSEKQRLARNWDRVKRDKYQSARYHALNVHSWCHRGTLEWRLPPGTRRASTILGYARTFHDLLHWGLRAKERDLWTLLNEAPCDSTRQQFDRRRATLAPIWTAPWTDARISHFRHNNDNDTTTEEN